MKHHWIDDLFWALVFVTGLALMQTILLAVADAGSWFAFLDNFK